MLVLKGIRCPKCKEPGLLVESVHRPAPGLIVRYRYCKACLEESGESPRVVTEERVARHRRADPKRGAPPPRRPGGPPKRRGKPAPAGKVASG